MSSPGSVLATFYDGIGDVPAASLNSYLQGAISASILRTLTGLSTMFVFLGGISYVGDGNGGLFYWNGSSTAADDNFNTIVPTGAATGAWLRLSGSIIKPGLNLRAISGNATLLVTDGILEIDASAGAAMVTIPIANASLFGTAIRRVRKTDTSDYPVYFSTDGITVFDSMASPANGSGQINAYRDISFNLLTANNPLIRSEGVG